MEYHEAVNALEGLRHHRPKLGTETTASLLAHLGDPHEGLPAVQVAGSNGKGSTARFLARVLREAGLDVGLYTSPHLSDLRERVAVNGRTIPKRELARFVDEEWDHVVARAAEGDEPTFFEAYTALALWYFDRRDVDVAVLEVGIGGRHDATSVVDPIASAVTSVSLEHTDILGSTVAEIARDKAQVAPADRPLVTGTTGAALDAVRGESDVLTVGGEDPDVTAHAGGLVPGAGDPDAPTAAAVTLAGPDWRVKTRTGLLGAHQATNAGIAAALARQVGDSLGVDVTESDVAAGVRNTTVAGRFEVLDGAPLTVLDGAHNPAACETLTDTLAGFDYDDIYLVFGAMRDKDHAAMCRALPAADRAFLAAPDVDRAQDTATLAAVFGRETDAALASCESVLAAVERALDAAGPADCVLVTGSLYVVGEARERWTRRPRVVDAGTPAQAREVLGHADVPPAEREQTAEGFVERTVRFRTRRETARDLRETMLSLGGTAAVSGVAAPDVRVDVVLGGTLAQFRGLVEAVRSSGEPDRLADQLERTLAGRRGRASTATPEAGARAAADGAGDYPWTEGTAVMGVLNVTPDSFHDGGEYDSREAAVARAREMAAAGADVVDVGGESTRPGADPVSAATEVDRVVPVVDALDDLDATVSVDTRKPSVAAAALAAGADMVNDVTGLADAAMRRVVADHDVPVVVMDSRNAPVAADRSHVYDDVVDDVFESLAERVLLAERAGIDRSRVVVDPGLGFGKQAGESFALLDRLAEFRALGTAVLVGHSRKSMFERADCGPGERLAPTVAATALAAERGADLVRVHDVPENVAAVATAAATTRRGE